MDKKIRFDIVNTRNIWFIISALVIAIGIGSLVVKGLNFGVDFTGGRILRFEAGRDVDTKEIEEIINRYEIQHNPAQILSGGREFIIRTSGIDAEKAQQLEDEQRLEIAEKQTEKFRSLKIDFNVELYDIDPEGFVLFDLLSRPSASAINSHLAKEGFASETVEIADVHTVPGIEKNDPPRFNVTLKFKGVESEDQLEKAARAIYEEFGGYRQFIQEDKIDPVFGSELKKKALIALLIATIGILLYVTIRFEFWFALAAIIALIHDCLITLGFYSVMQLEVNGAFVAIILTVFGYSINDTIIIFDRIRENMRKDKRSPLDKVINVSLWETMPRSINTVITTEITIVAILIFGGSSIQGFAMGLMVGVLSGCYSSILVAAPVAFIFKMMKGSEERDSVVPASSRAKTKKARKSEIEHPADSGSASGKSAKNAKSDKPSAAPSSKKNASGGSSKSGKKKGKQRRR